MKNGHKATLLFIAVFMTGCAPEDNSTLCHPKDWIETDMFGHCKEGDDILIRDIQAQEGAPYTLAYLASNFCEVSTITVIPDDDGSQSVLCRYSGTKTIVQPQL